MIMLKNIDLDLAVYSIQLNFKDNTKPLSISFDTPSRKFYFSIIVLVVNEMKNSQKHSFIHIRKHEKILRLLDRSLGGMQYRSKTGKAMWDKIRKAWRYSLPDLEAATHFKILNRYLIPPYGKGERHRYKCSENECDIWANLFQYDKNNTWRFKFDIESAFLGLEDIRLKFNDLRDNSAWQEFIKQKRSSATSIRDVIEKIKIKHKNRRWRIYAVPVIIFFLLFVTGVSIFNRIYRPVISSDKIGVLDKPSIAILPFVNIDSDPDKEYLCDGITEEIINKVAKFRDLRVISRTSAFSLKNSGMDIRTIGEKLRVDNVLEGSIRTSNGKLRITAQLIKVADDSHLWSESYNHEMINVFGLQEKIAQEIACELKSKLGCKGDEVTGKPPTKDFEAYNHYLKGHFHLMGFSFGKSIEFFQKAIEIDSNFAAAYAGLARAYGRLAMYSFEPGTPYYQKAMSAVLKALEIDDQLAEAYSSLGTLKTSFDWDWKGAEKANLRALDLNAGSAETHIIYEQYLRIVGRLDEANEEGKIALSLDPLSQYANRHYGLSLLINRRYDAAIKQLETTLDMFPDSSSSLLYLGDAYLAVGRDMEGIALMEEAYKRSKGKYPFINGIVGYAYGKVGKTETAKKLLSKALEKRKAAYFSSLAIAFIYQGLGNTDKTFEWLEKAYEEKEPLLSSIKNYPQLWTLHEDIRFKTLINKMGFGN